MKKSDYYNTLFEYKEGKLFWKISRNPKIKIGDLAGRKFIGTNGYYSIFLDKKSSLIHRIIWVMHHREIPDGLFIDHINRNKLDNRIENLRLVSPRESVNNRDVVLTRKFPPGIRKHGNKYLSFIRMNKKHISLGSFSTPEEAQNIREEFMRKNNIR